MPAVIPSNITIERIPLHPTSHSMAVNEPLDETAGILLSLVSPRSMVASLTQPSFREETPAPTGRFILPLRSHKQ